MWKYHSIVLSNDEVARIIVDHVCLIWPMNPNYSLNVPISETVCLNIKAMRFQRS